ncbi:MAG: hypothetical protein JXB42_09245 [Deltaproteobacteria bacterium]|nr:hypothetical protein [Deltaproteobacteria bacterium]
MRYRRLIANIILILFAVTVTGCSYVGEYVEMSQDGTVSSEYLDALNRWTRDKTIYSHFETRAHISATKKSRDFNDAYLSEYARIYIVSDQKKELNEQLLADRKSQFTEFLFYAYIPDRESNDFSKENSIWKIFLINKRGERFEPVDIRRIKEVTPVIRELFPYVNPHYGNFYSVSFPQEDPPSEISEECRLIFASILGRVELAW